MNSQLDLQHLIQTSIQESLPEDVVQQVLSAAPFIPVPLALNLRTISSPNLAPNAIYRSGGLTHLPPSSLNLLKSDYKITTIFDLRSQKERERHPSPVVEGIDTVWIPTTTDVGPTFLGGASSVEDQDKKIQHLTPADFVANNGINGYIAMYSDVLETHKEAYKTIFTHLRDNKESHILFHCTAGKDRTGVLAALIHALLDSPEDIIALDYSLTRIGVEPLRERLFAALVLWLGRNPDDIRIESMGEEPGLEAMCGVRGASILAFLESMDEKYGSLGASVGGPYLGAKGYLIQELGFGLDDLKKIKENLSYGINKK